MNWVDYLMAFLVGGLICLIAQILLDCFRLLPVHLIVLFVIVDLLEILKIYDWLIKSAGPAPCADIEFRAFAHACGAFESENRVSWNLDRCFRFNRRRNCERHFVCFYHSFGVQTEGLMC